MKLAGDHAYKLEDCCAYVGKDYIKKASQKVESGPVYRKTWGCPPYGKESGGTIYCKK